MIYRLTDEADWQRAQIDGAFASADLASEGFIHCSAFEQILRTANKHIRYTGSKQTEVVILLHFCSTLKSHGIPFNKSTALKNLYDQQIKKIKTSLASLHEDLQYDFQRELNLL